MIITNFNNKFIYGLQNVQKLLKGHPAQFAEFVSYALTETFTNDLSILAPARKILDDMHLSPPAKFEWEGVERAKVELSEPLENEYMSKQKAKL